MNYCNCFPDLKKDVPHIRNCLKYGKHSIRKSLDYEKELPNLICIQDFQPMETLNQWVHAKP